MLWEVASLARSRGMAAASPPRMPMTVGIAHRQALYVNAAPIAQGIMKLATMIPYSVRALCSTNKLALWATRKNGNAATIETAQTVMAGLSSWRSACCGEAIPTVGLSADRGVGLYVESRDSRICRYGASKLQSSEPTNLQTYQLTTLSPFLHEPHEVPFRVLEEDHPQLVVGHFRDEVRLIDKVELAFHGSESFGHAGNLEVKDAVAGGRH